MDLNENTLNEICSEALSNTNRTLNGHWKRAYLALADAADRLHAMEHRSIVKSIQD